MTETRRWWCGILLAVALVAAGCAETDDGDDASAPTTVGESGPGTTAESPDADTTDVDSGGTGGVTGPALEWALDYTGGSAEVAAGDPIEIGVASNASFFPEIEEGAELAAEFVNRDLGGVNGRPIELVTCLVVTAEDGAACGAQFANDDDIVLVVTGSMLAGNDELFGAVSGIKPTYIVDPVSVADYTTTDAVSYNTAALGAAMGGGIFLAEDLMPERAAARHHRRRGRPGSDHAAGTGARRCGDRARLGVRPSDGHRTRDRIRALRSIGPDTVDAILLGLFQQGCIAAYDALRNLGIDAREQPVATTYACWGPNMQAHVANSGESGLLPDGWYYANPLGYNLFGSDLDSGLDTYHEAVEAAGGSESVTIPGLAESFAAVMSMARHLNAVDGDFSFDRVDTEIRGFEGPAMLQAGPIACGAPPVFTGVCSTRVSIHRYLDGGWEDVRAGDDLIDISPIVMEG